MRGGVRGLEGGGVRETERDREDTPEVCPTKKKKARPDACTHQLAFVPDRKSCHTMSCQRRGLESDDKHWGAWVWVRAREGTDGKEWNWGGFLPPIRPYALTHSPPPPLLVSPHTTRSQPPLALPSRHLRLH